MYEYFRRIKFELKYLLLAIKERDRRDIKHHWYNLFHDITVPYRDIKYGIQNLITWFPIVWRDRNWDHYFFFQILKTKLKGMEKDQRVYDRHLSAQREARKMRICLYLLDRIIKDDYCVYEREQHDKKYGKLDWTSEPNDFDKNGKVLTYRMIFNRDKVDPNDKKLSEYERKASLRISKKEVQIRKQDIDMLFNIIKRNVQGWWS